MAKKKNIQKSKVAKKKSVKKTVKKKVAKKAAKKKVVSKKKKVVNKLRTSNLAPQTFKVHQTKLKAGDVAPFFVGHDQHSNQISLNDFIGKTLVLYFYPKDDTSGCTAQSCSLRDEYQYLTQQNYAVVGVSADDV